MTTLAAFIREALRRGGTEAGYVAAVSALATTSVTAVQLADGSPSSKFEGKFLTRRDSVTAADHARVCQSWAGTTGAFTISGANYGDTTITSEFVEVTDLDPYLLEWACQITLGRLKHFDAVEFPSYDGVRYWLHDLTWVTSLADLTGYRVTYRPTPQLTRNRYMEKWHIVNPGTAASTALPDHWSISGASGTCVRTTTGAVQGKYAAGVLRSGTDVLFYQSVPEYVLPDLLGTTVGFTAKITASSASQVRVQVYDGVGTTSSSYHTGGGEPETLTASHSVSSSATELTFRVQVAVNGTVYVDEAYGYCGSTSDALEKDNFGEEIISPRWSTNGGLNLILPQKGIGGQFLVYTKRPYPQFSETSLMSHAANGDDIDAPLVAVATGILARAYEQAAASVDSNPRKPFYAAEAAKWGMRFDQEARRNLYNEQSTQGKRAIKRAFRAAPLRFGGRR